MTGSSRLCGHLSYLARDVELRLERQLESLHHEVPIDPFEEHLATMVAERLLQQAERPNPGNGNLPGKGSTL